MQWRFWKWQWRRERSEQRAKETVVQDPAQVLLSHSSPSEILALQQLIGNQAVLRLLGQTSAQYEIKGDPP